MWGPNSNRNPNYGGPWLWRAVTSYIPKRFTRLPTHTYPSTNRV